MRKNECEKIIPNEMYEEINDILIFNNKEYFKKEILISLETGTEFYRKNGILDFYSKIAIKFNDNSSYTNILLTNNYFVKNGVNLKKIGIKGTSYSQLPDYQPELVIARFLNENEIIISSIIKEIRKKAMLQSLITKNEIMEIFFKTIQKYLIIINEHLKLKGASNV